MQTLNSFKSSIFHINNQSFDEFALELFQFQYHNNPVYQAYVDYLNIDPDKISNVAKIPYLPIRFFKHHKIVSGDFVPKQIFESSGTTLSYTSKHYIEDLQFYNEISTSIFTRFFGGIHQAVILGLLPSYLERSNSSLVFMVNHFIAESQHELSGFYLNNYQDLITHLEVLKKEKVPVFLFGVTFALLEFSDKYKIDLPNLVVIETGGMKGRGKEMVREELHQHLKRAFNTKHIYSEYGMTELLSQAYLQEDDYFHVPPWMRVSIRDINDPFDYVKNSKTGAINVIDLANIHSCVFIETEDLGVMTDKGFKVLGRMDNSDMRGCNLLLA